MSNIRLKDKAEVGRDLNDNDLIFVTKTSEDTDNPSTFARIKNQITSNATGLTETFYSKTGHTHSTSEINSLDGRLNTKANLSGATFTGAINSISVSSTTLSAETIYSGSTNLGNIFAKTGEIINYTPQLNTKANLSGATFTGDVNISTMSATTLSAETIIGGIKYDTLYLTYSGTSGTTSAISMNFGATLTAPGEWTITKFNAVYYFDDTDGNLTITIPDAAASNLGKVMIVSKPRLVQSGNHILIKTASNQAIAETSTFYLRSPNDRAEIISVPFIANGSAGYKYRVNMIDRSIHESIEVSIGGTQLFSDIKSAVDYCNSYADGPRRIKVNPGDYYISDTVEINCPYNIVIQGFSPEVTKFYATTSLSGRPMFDVVTQCDFDRITFSGYTGYGLVDDECCIDSSSDDLYIELHNVVIDGFYKGFELDGDSEGWLFDSIVRNCQYGIWTSGASMGISEVSLINNYIGIQFESTSTSNVYSVQNTIFTVNSGQTGIYFKDDTYKPDYHFATGNAFYGDGTYISGLTFTSTTQADIRYENNVGLQNYKPECFVWVSGNTTATTLTTQGTYYKASVLTPYIVNVDMIKFSGGADTQFFTYLPDPSRRGYFTISGDLSSSNNNDIISVSLFKNGTTKLQDIDVRCATASQPYPFAFNGVDIMNHRDAYDIRLSCTNAATRTSILRTLMFTVAT